MKTYKFKNVKRLGRTYLAKDGNLWCSYGASGIAFKFKGTKCIVNFISDEINETPTYCNARVGIFINDEFKFDILFNKERTEPFSALRRQAVEIINTANQIDAASQTNGIGQTDTASQINTASQTECEVKILKLSEGQCSNFAIESIEAEGEISPAEEKKLKIEFVGDSITCGYGIENPSFFSVFTTKTENCLKAFAYRTAELLDADCSLVAVSGIGVLSSNNGREDNMVMKDCYENFGFSDGSFHILENYSNGERNYSNSIEDGFQEVERVKPKDVPWDFSEFIADIVVLNLGTNDAFSLMNTEENHEKFIAAYIDFLKLVRDKNLKAKIVCTLGTMDTSYCKYVEKAASLFAEKYNDQNIKTLFFEIENPYEDGLATGGHPTEIKAKKDAAKLADFIKKNCLEKQ